jgi:hypothetical protein
MFQPEEEGQGSGALRLTYISDGYYNVQIARSGAFLRLDYETLPDSWQDVYLFQILPTGSGYCLVSKTQPTKCVAYLDGAWQLADIELQSGSVFAFVGMEALSGWHQTLNRWHYYEDGTPLTGWQNVDDNWYYFDQTGVPQFGWLSDEDNWYYFLENGTMARDQELTFGSWTTRFDENGHWIPAE